MRPPHQRHTPQRAVSATQSAVGDGSAMRRDGTTTPQNGRRQPPLRRAVQRWNAALELLSAAFGGAGSKPIFETRLWAVPQLGTRMHLIHLTIMSTAQAQKHHAHPTPTATSKSRQASGVADVTHASARVQSGRMSNQVKSRYFVHLQRLPKYDVRRHNAHAAVTPARTPASAPQ